MTNVSSLPSKGEYTHKIFLRGRCLNAARSALSPGNRIHNIEGDTLISDSRLGISSRLRLGPGRHLLASGQYVLPERESREISWDCIRVIHHGVVNCGCRCRGGKEFERQILREKIRGGGS